MNLVVINIVCIDAVDDAKEYLGVVIHENGHKTIKSLSIGKKMFEAIYAEAKQLAPHQAKTVDERYINEPLSVRGEEIVTNALQTRAAFNKASEKLMKFFEGEISEDDILNTFNISLPLRDKVIKDILIALRDGYNNKHNNEYANNNREAQEGAFGNRRRSEHLGSASRGGLLASTRYSY